ncbi:uncharacterized protein BDR25DRAFT_301792 [Lindgomyces ingoldianus]|uniref:Uncharacterized protein n=1 Tax=Lindgomyces ingoldianus TaxID=673940 RepID=A0ACB6R5C7_9PLEO|nr:uncharacterized protein BDR25DRAFT_301792 [Lindgomyces ingoldianus]KAF2474464.1 hypothetical protein BDR25DRAFT_301792 [Lindgomyces ingoldianus]
MAESVVLRQRLLKDVTELQRDPYPNISLYLDEKDVTKACLILTPNGGDPLHLTIQFPERYPLLPPTISIQSQIEHPNIFGSYICASMLNTEEGWTSAYTLKGIAIQLLSFFSSERIEQEYGGHIELATYRRNGYGYRAIPQHPRPYTCNVCIFGNRAMHQELPGPMQDVTAMDKEDGNLPQDVNQKCGLFKLSDEVVLLILDQLGTADIFSFADAIPSLTALLNSYDFIRTRELVCFCLKKSFMDTKLGIGVSIKSRGRRPVFQTEFDLLSNEAFTMLKVRKSILGMPFNSWLPLPLSRRHWNLVRLDAMHSIGSLRKAAHMEQSSKVDVLYHFMNNIVVQFSNDAEGSDARSTLTHASEKAVEAYFALFHLLLCSATEDPAIVNGANATVANFLTGPRNKTVFPDLGHMLVAALVSDAGLTEELTFTIIKEAVLRNVVWMLDVKGANMPELAYLEPSAISEYRLAKTFEASKTSYRLLMFLKLFSSTARNPGKSLDQLCDALFDTHGAPPPGTSAWMAGEIRRIRDINGFPAFLKMMGIKQMPTKEVFTAYLRKTIIESVEQGYSVMHFPQIQAYVIRKRKEPGVEMSKEILEVNPTTVDWQLADSGYVASFFPGRIPPQGRGGRGGGWRGGRSNWRGGSGGRGYGRGGRS